MRKSSLFLVAASALVLASCSEDVKQTPENTLPTEEGLTLTALSSGSQSGRIKTYGETRGEKSERLKLVHEIAPVTGTSAELYNWSATGIAIAPNGSVYVSWHSDKQAKNGATAWGGAIDNIASAADGNGYTFAYTLVSDEAKINNILADGSTLYASVTSAKNGAVVGRVVLPPSPATVLMDTVAVQGSSVNAVAISGDNLYAVAGYMGGAYSFSKNFDKGTADNKKKVEISEVAKFSKTYGGKYIVGDYILRTDASNCYIDKLDGTNVVKHEGHPLVSSPKNSEKYDYTTGTWTVGEDKATYYGKHTMAVDGNYIYVAGGKAAKGTKDGLRVYDKTTGQQVWGNATNTTAVCVADGYVYAATGAGLRVYKTYDAEKNTLELYAFEVEKNEDGTLKKDADGNLVAGTTAHSCNFVAVVGKRIYMANGQSGVYVFELDTTAPAQPGADQVENSDNAGSDSAAE